MEFYNLISMPTFKYYGISSGIVILSIFTRTVAMKLAQCVTFTSESKRSFLTVIFIFLVFFNNYGIVYLIAPMRINLPLISDFVMGIYLDFNYSWFKDIGGGLIIFVAVINTTMPPTMLVIDLLLKKVLRAIDQGRCCS